MPGISGSWKPGQDARGFTGGVSGTVPFPMEPPGRYSPFQTSCHSFNIGLYRLFLSVLYPVGLNKIERYPEVAIIILNWNSWKDTVECLEPIQRSIYPNYLIVVVDNGSSDASLEYLLAWCEGKMVVQSKFFEQDPKRKPVYWVKYDQRVAEKGGIKEKEDWLRSVPSEKRLVIIQNPENLGFAEGSNVGIRYALARGSNYVCLLNNDTVVKSDSMSVFVKRMNADSSLGILGGKIYWYDNPSELWYAGGFISIIGRGPGYVMDRSEKRDFVYTSFVSGYLMFLRWEVFEGLVFSMLRCFLVGRMQIYVYVLPKLVLE